MKVIHKHKAILMAWSLRGYFMKDLTVLIICGIAIIVSALFAAYIINDTLSISTTEFHLYENDPAESDNAVEDVSDDYPEYSPTFGNYKILGDDLEDRLIETSAGEKYVLGGDGYYAGTDSNGNYKIGTYMGKY